MYIGSYYHDKYDGKVAANGTIFRQNKLTAASNKHKFGDSLLITNLKNGKSVTVIVTDRLNKKYSDRIDLSKKAFKEIASLKEGIIQIKVEIL